ncbi:FAD-dependent oxidoreductase [Amaricoccus sp. W119]|uniref:NAD(P)/FAD-dependent oxidoreductase n=1 Tax=Amaricoccus sp. W119 TaxID=3391833 RepID=UPI0039A6BF6A
MTRHIHLHVGLPKTATTAIQRGFARNHAAIEALGVLYPTRGQPRQPVTLYGHHNLAYELHAPGQFDARRGGWVDVRDEIEASAAPRVLISSEAFRESLAPVVVAKLRKLFPEARRTVVIYARPQWEYVESAYNQFARFGRADQPIAEFWETIARRRTEYRRIVEAWQARFGEECVRCLPFDGGVKRLGAVEHFAQKVFGFEPGAVTNFEEARLAALGDGAAAPALVNPKAGVRAIGAVRYARDFLRDSTGNPEAALPAATANRILRELREAGDDTSRSFMVADLGRRIFEEAAATNRWLAERFPGFDTPDFLEEPDWTRLRPVGDLPEPGAADKALCRRLVRKALGQPGWKGRSGAKKHVAAKADVPAAPKTGAEAEAIPAKTPAGEDRMAMTDYPPSYYAASANPAPERRAFRGEAAPGVCIVGAGFTGLSAGIDLAAKGHEVMILEAERVGWGASGRNGGQIVNGLNAGLDTIERRYGAGTAGFVASLVQEGGEIIRERIAKYAIDCDLRDGNLFAALTPRHMAELEAKQALWRRHGLDNFEMLDATEIRRHVATDFYAGGMLDPTGGHMHPLNLALGEAAAFEREGGVIHERSRVERIEAVEGRPVLHLAGGVVRPKLLLLAGNAYLGPVVPDLDTRVMPFSTQIIATEPLGERGPALLPTGVCVEDIRYILDYYRLSADGRLLFGGGTVYGGTDPADIRAKIQPNLAKVFPDLAGARIDYAWSGNCAISFSRVPQMGRLGASTYFAAGYSGHGVVGSHLFGRIIASAIDGDAGRFDTFAAVPWVPFPGGQRFRVPYSMLGSWWYGLRDRLGV